MAPSTTATADSLPFPRTENTTSGLNAASTDGTKAAASGEDLVNRVAQTAHDTIDRLAQKATPHVERLRQGVDGAGSMLNERTDQLKSMGDEWTETLRTTVREHPLAAIGTALAVGMLFARLSR